MLRAPRFRFRETGLARIRHHFPESGLPPVATEISPMQWQFPDWKVTRSLHSHGEQAFSSATDLLESRRGPRVSALVGANSAIVGIPNELERCITPLSLPMKYEQARILRTISSMVPPVSLGAFNVFLLHAERRDAITGRDQPGSELGIVRPTLARPKPTLRSAMEADQIPVWPGVFNLTDVVIPYVFFGVVDAQELLGRLKIEARLVQCVLGVKVIPVAGPNDPARPKGIRVDPKAVPSTNTVS